MYQSGIVVTLAVNGITLRELGEFVYLPFGSEYSINIKNVSGRRALVNVDVDGSDVLDGNRLILEAYGTIRLQRSISNGNMTDGNAFKFIAHTEGTKQHRGEKAQDGLIRVSVYQEPVPTLTRGLSDFGLRSKSASASGVSGSMIGGVANYSAQSSSEQLRSAQAVTTGFTAPGAIVSQQFTQGASFATVNTPIVVVMKLMGESNATPVVAPLTVATKLTCSSCGAVHASTASFCSDCGTALIVR